MIIFTISFKHDDKIDITMSYVVEKETEIDFAYYDCIHNHTQA